MIMERILLQTVKFELQVEHPYSFLLLYAKQIKGGEDHAVYGMGTVWLWVDLKLFVISFQNTNILCKQNKPPLPSPTRTKKWKEETTNRKEIQSYKE